MEYNQRGYTIPLVDEDYYKRLSDMGKKNEIVISNLANEIGKRYIINKDSTVIIINEDNTINTYTVNEDGTSIEEIVSEEFKPDPNDYKIFNGFRKGIYNKLQEFYDNYNKKINSANSANNLEKVLLKTGYISSLPFKLYSKNNFVNAFANSAVIMGAVHGIGYLVSNYLTTIIGDPIMVAAAPILSTMYLSKRAEGINGENTKKLAKFGILMLGAGLIGSEISNHFTNLPYSPIKYCWNKISEAIHGVTKIKSSFFSGMFAFGFGKIVREAYKMKELYKQKKPDKK